MLTRKHLMRATTMLFAFTMVAAACGSDSDTEAGTSTSEADGASTSGAGSGSGSGSSAAGGENLSGDVVVSGSSTVEPISVAVAEDFATVQPDVNVSVSGPGTGDGFKEFCAGNTDISDASRKIKDEEVAACEEAGIEYVELKVGIDGIAVITSEGNDAVSCLSFPDLYALLGPESVGFKKWSDANTLATEVGGTGGFPDADLVISAPGTESGTYDSFVELALTEIAEAQGQEPGARPDYSSAADDNVIIQTVSSNDTSLGWVGFAYADQASGVKMLEVSKETGGECIAPDADTIAGGSYPLARDMYIYVSKASMA
ncbi:MAG: substrate-binding domain-containing protein, partial [Acidimicrobiales bacterium]